MLALVAIVPTRIPLPNLPSTILAPSREYRAYRSPVAPSERNRDVVSREARGLVVDPVTTVAGRPAQITLRRGAGYYAGWFTADDPHGIGPPLAPPMAYVVERGRTRVLGPGIPDSWIPGGDLVAAVAVKKNGEPAGWEDSSVVNAFVYAGGKTYNLGRLRFLTRRADGSVVLYDSDTSADADHGRELPVGLYVWRHKKLVPWVRLPKGWRPVVADTESGLLVRKDRYGDDANWTIGIVHGRHLAPIRFETPRNTRGMIWYETRWLRPDGAFRILLEGAKNTDLILRPVRR